MTNAPVGRINAKVGPTGSAWYDEELLNRMAKGNKYNEACILTFVTEVTPLRTRL